MATTDRHRTESANGTQAGEQGAPPDWEPALVVLDSAIKIQAFGLAALYLIAAAGVFYLVVYEIVPLLPALVAHGNR